MTKHQKNLHGVLAVVFVTLAAGTAYYFHTHTKRFYAQTIIKLNGASTFSALMDMDVDYLHAWAKGLAKGSTSFVYGGSSYRTSGGTKIV